MPAPSRTSVFNDLRIARSFKIRERAQLQGIMDLFNVINKFNVADVNPIWNSRRNADCGLRSAPVPVRVATYLVSHALFSKRRSARSAVCFSLPC